MNYDWNKPQRQPWAGLGVVFLNTFWEILKAFWPFIIIFLLGKGEGRVNRYEIIGIALLSITIVSAILKFLFFRFSLEDKNLVIRSGWLKKEVKIIPLEKIQSVNIEQGPLHQLLNIVKLSIDTAGSQKTEAKIDALHKSMATSLREQLLLKATQQETIEEEKESMEPLVRLNMSDLLKLSISANHVETFFIILSFVFGLWENFRSFEDEISPRVESILPDNSVLPVLALVIFVLVFTISVSTVRIFFRFYDMTVFRIRKGFYIKSGLTNLKERLVPFKKIQYVTWKTNWIRKLMDLWIFEYRIAMSNEIKSKEKVQVPITHYDFIPLLATDYYEIPNVSEKVSIRMDRSFVARRLLIVGLLPAFLLMISTWYFWNAKSLFFRVYPLLIWVTSYCIQKKFRLWAFEDIAYIKKGIFGESFTIVQWQKLQLIVLKQSIFQRKKGLASIVLHTAAGAIHVNFIPLTAARQLMNYALYIIEKKKNGNAIDESPAVQNFSKDSEIIDPDLS